MNPVVISPQKEAKSPLLNRILALSGFGLLFDSMDNALLAFVLTSIGMQWHLSSSTMGMLGSISFIGMAVGSAIAGLLADRYGRKNVFMWTLLIYSIATGLTSFADGVGVFILLRFLVGFGLGGELPVATTYVLESSPEAERGRRVVYLETFWALGSLAAALISYFVVPTIGWRVVFLIGALPALYTLILRFGLPESAEFQTLSKLPSMKTSFLTLWTRGIASRTVVTSLLWFIMNFAYYGMFLWLPSVLYLKGYSLVHSIGYVLLMTVAQVPGYLTAAWLVETWGRKRTLVAALLFTSLSALGFGFAHSTVTVLVYGILLNFFMLAAFAGTYIFTVEQFPTLARASGMGFAAGFGRIGGIIAPFFVGSLIGLHVGFPALFSIFFVTVLAGFIMISLFGHETKRSNAA